MYVIWFKNGTTEEWPLKELETHENQNVVSIGDVGFKFVKKFSKSGYFDGVVTKNVQIENMNASLMMAKSKITQ